MDGPAAVHQLPVDDSPASPRDAGFRATLAQRVSPERLRQLGGWFVLGVAAVAVEIGLLALLHDGLGMPLWAASALAAEALILARFVIADRWVFGHRRPAFDRLWRYHGACAGAFVISWLVLNGSAALLGVPYLLAALLGTGASFTWSLLTNFLWVWRTR